MTNGYIPLFVKNVFYVFKLFKIRDLGIVYNIALEKCCRSVRNLYLKFIIIYFQDFVYEECNSDWKERNVSNKQINEQYIIIKVQIWKVFNNLFFF